MVRVRVRVAHEHLVDEDAQGPPVDPEAVPFVRDDLGREVLGRAWRGLRVGLGVGLEVGLGVWLGVWLGVLLGLGLGLGFGLG